MLKRPIYGNQEPLAEKPLVQRLVESLDRVVRERHAEYGASHLEPLLESKDMRERPQDFVPRHTTILEHDPLEEFSGPEQMRALISDPTDAPMPIEVGTKCSPVRPSMEHLYYGGQPAATQPIYRHNCKPAPAVTFRTQKRLELLVRLENSGIPDSQVASMLSISVPRVRQLKRSKDYLRARIKITHGLILDQELALEQIKDQRREILREMLPPALQVIANAVLTRPSCFAEAKLQVSVAQDILDREGTFAKISRSEVKPVEHFDWESTDASAAQIVSLMRGSIGEAGTTIRVAEGHTAKLIEITKAFTSGSNITPEEAIAAAKMLDEAETKELGVPPPPPEGWAAPPKTISGRR